MKNLLLGMAMQATLTALLTKLDIIKPTPIQQGIAALFFYLIYFLV